MDKSKLYTQIVEFIKELQKEKLVKAIDEVQEELKKADPKTKLQGVLLDKAKGTEKERRKQVASEAHSKKFNPKNNWGLDDPVRGHHFGINRQMEGAKPGVSEIGQHVRDKATRMSTPVERRKDVLQSLKDAPKPSLPKSEEMNKSKADQKLDVAMRAAGFDESDVERAKKKARIGRRQIGEHGVHESDSQGVSMAGSFLREKDKDSARAEHKDIIKQLKSQPKANLPKSELEKAKIYDFKSGKMTADLGQPDQTTPPKGNLKVVDDNFKPEKPQKAKKAPKQKIAKNGGTAANPTSRIDTGFGRVIAKKELQKEAAPAPASAPMPKPSMPKMKQPKLQQPKMQMPSKLAHSELAKGKDLDYVPMAAGKHGWPKAGEKGVHQPPSRMAHDMGMANNPGESTAGFHAIMGKKKPSLGFKENARSMHRQKLSELKNMPKADLPKSEDMNKNNMWKSFMEKCMKCMSMKKDDKAHAKGTPEHAAHEVVESGKNLHDAIQQVKAKDQSKMMDHLKTLDDPKNQRSPEKQEIGEIMSKKKRKSQDIQVKAEKSSSVIENREPVRQYANFEAFWAANVKNGKEIHLKSCKAHLEAKGWLKNPDNWTKGVRDFGIPVEE